ncbi:unnamed protein product, partial [Ranitomeya imitator]
MMKQLICSPDLLVMQVEMDVYTALKKWMFLQLVPSWSGSLIQLLAEADDWFSKRRKELEDTGITFLETDRGCPFVPVFKHLRMQYIISDLASARIIERDALIPAEWLSSMYKQQWFTMLRAEQDNDTGQNLVLMINSALEKMAQSHPIVVSRFPEDSCGVRIHETRIRRGNDDTVPASAASLSLSAPLHLVGLIKDPQFLEWGSDQRRPVGKSTVLIIDIVALVHL